MATLTLGGDDMQVQEWATLLTATGVGGGVTAALSALVGRRGRRVDNLAKLEQIATGMVERANADADRRVSQIEQAFAAHKLDAEQTAARRAVAAAAHAEWDRTVAEQLRNLGAAVPPPPPLEGAAL